MDGEPGKAGAGRQKTPSRQGHMVCGHFYDGDPKSVEHLPMEVREEMTRQLMGKFKQMDNQSSA